MSENSYIAVLEQSLTKKTEILDTIAALNVQQKEMLDDPELDPDTLDENLHRKAELVEELEKLDNGFEQVYERIKTELTANRVQHQEAIARMQKLISLIVEKSTQIQLQEQRNKALMEQKFSTVKKQIREVKQSRKAVSSYYQSMSKMNLVDPQFLDNKK